MNIQNEIENLKKNDLPKGFNLNLAGNQISAIGAKELADAIKNNPKLPEGFNLNLRYNQISAIGAKELADAILSLKKPGLNKIIIIEDNIEIQKAIQEQNEYIDNHYNQVVTTIGRSYSLSNEGRKSNSTLRKLTFEPMAKVLSYLLPSEYNISGTYIFMGLKIDYFIEPNNILSLEQIKNKTIQDITKKNVTRGCSIQ